MKQLWKAEEIKKLIQGLYGIDGDIKKLGGDVDHNFHIKTDGGEQYILKISPPEVNLSYTEFQIAILRHLGAIDAPTPQVVVDLNGAFFSQWEWEGKMYKVKLLSWLEGDLWSSITLRKKSHYYTLGQVIASIAKGLEGFEHPMAQRYLEWDLDQAQWLSDARSIHQGRQRDLVFYFWHLYNEIVHLQPGLRKSFIHNDANENNILVKGNQVFSVIDYGDAIYTSLINDVAIAIAYAVMDSPDPVQAGAEILKGYHQVMPLKIDEINLIYRLVGIRLSISVTKSSIAFQKDPGNEYHQISAKGAWGLLERWREIPEIYATATFRKACGMEAFNVYASVKSHLQKHKIPVHELFKIPPDWKPCHIDLSIGSTLLGHPDDYNDPQRMQRMLDEHQEEMKADFSYGGYMESRPFYITDAYLKEGVEGPEYMTIHLGEDYWLPAKTEIICPLDAEVVLIQDNQFYKDYGPTIVLKHTTAEGIPFYTLYGHLTQSSLQSHRIGDRISRGEVLAEIGEDHENGSWAPHLHFQIMIDLLDNASNFPGVTYPDEMELWMELCPSPGYLIGLDSYPIFNPNRFETLLSKRNNALGPSLSLSYDDPLFIVRGQGQYLFDYKGQKFLDMVNNVAHVGHEHPGVVKSLRKQSAVLNTNSRYLHPAILEYAEALLNKLPSNLSVVYFVNSGSEANELAMRMCKTVTGRQDIIAIQGGYHGNTQACIDVSSYKFDGKGGQGKPDNTSLLPMPDSFRGMHRGDLSETGMDYAQYIDEIILKLEERGKKPAAFISESILSCGGQLVLPDGYLAYVYQKVRENGGLCIADEVQTGFGRVGSKFWAFELQDVVPDIVTMGKPIGNGHPIGAVACTQEIADDFNNGMEFFNTYGGNPVSSRVGLEVLRVIEEEGLQSHSLDMGNVLLDGLKNLQEKFNCIGDVRGHGLFVGFELVDKMAPNAKLAHHIVQEMRKRNILLSTDGPDHNVIKIKPPLCIQEADLVSVLDQLEVVLTGLCRS